MSSKNSGLAQLWVLVGLVIMAVALPIASMLVSNNQDNRNRAAGESVCIYDTATRSVVCVTPTNSPVPLPTTSNCNIDPKNSCDPTVNTIGQFFWWLNPSDPPSYVCLGYECAHYVGCSDPKKGSYDTSTSVKAPANSCDNLPIPTPTPLPTSFICNSRVGGDCGYAYNARCCTDLGLECNTTSKTCVKVTPTFQPVLANPIPTNTNVSLNLSCYAAGLRKNGCPCKSSVQCASLRCRISTDAKGRATSVCTPRNQNI